MKRFIAFLMTVCVLALSCFSVQAVQSVTLALDADTAIHSGQNFTVRQTVKTNRNIGAATMTLQYDSNKLTVKKVTGQNGLELAYHSVGDTLYTATYSKEPLSEFVLNIRFQPKNSADEQYVFSANITDACDENGKNLICTDTAVLSISVTAYGSTKKATHRTATQSTAQSSKSKTQTSRSDRNTKRPTEISWDGDENPTDEIASEQGGEATEAGTESVVSEYSISTDSNTYKQNDFLFFVGIVAVVLIAVGAAYKMGAKSNQNRKNQ